jgi:endonuclease/exonuclease/phosphatase family metal-dependent hydrolase
MEEAMSQFNPIDVYIFVILAQVRVDRSLLDTATLSLNTKQFTIVSYNIHSDTNATAEVLQSIGADIIVVQEVHLASFELLQEELGSNFASFGGFTDNYGIGIFSKWPLRDVSLKRCSLSNRILQVSSVVLPLGEIKIGHTHLSPIGEELRMQELKEFGVSDAGLDILIGDFNSVRQSDYTASEWNCIAEDRSTNPQVVNFLLESFQDPWDDKELRGQDSLSYSSKQAKTRIDYAFVKAKEPRIQVEQIEYMDCDASDHYPLIVDFVQLKK